MGQARSVLWTYDFQYNFFFSKNKKINRFGASKMSYRQVFFIQIVLLAPMGKW